MESQGSNKERERERERKRKREGERGMATLKEMTVALTPFSYLV
jgi:hypothetical protein